jgi:hypothetical protein
VIVSRGTTEKEPGFDLPKQPIAFSEGRPVTISQLALDFKLRTPVERIRAESEWNEIRGKAVRVTAVR